MEVPHPTELSEARIDLEFDFKGAGGVQRFIRVSDIEAWLAEEREFWRWLDSPPATNHTPSIPNVHTQFWGYENAIKDAFTRRQNEWNQIQLEIKRSEDVLNNNDLTAELSEQEKGNIKRQNESLDFTLKELRNEIVSTLENEVVVQKFHITRLEPEAQFISELADMSPVSAVFALDQILMQLRQSHDRVLHEYNGRMLAALYAANLNRKLRPDNTAFKNAIQTWGVELGDFKGRFETQEQKFEEVLTLQKSRLDDWKLDTEEAREVLEGRTNEAFENFEVELELTRKNLVNLTEVYESHMQLKGPLIYWRGKRKEHLKGIKSLRAWAIAGAIFAVILMVGAAWFLLPENLPKEIIPWRPIGFFVLISTVSLWLVRLLVKLLLSHIHLYADAKEREVMISTFMALIRRPESRELLTKEDIALVLAPIFNPSTTGVIKDDGAPVSLGDFISRLGGK